SSLVKPTSQQSSPLLKSKPPTGLNRTISLSHNDPTAKTRMTLTRAKLVANKVTNNSQDAKLKAPIKLFSGLQSTSKLSVRPSLRTSRVNATNLNRPLRPTETPKSAMRKTIIGSVRRLPTAVPSRKPTNADPLRKPVNTGSSRMNALSTQRRRTMALKDIQDSFKPNPASLEEILSSKTSNDANRKRSETIIRNPKLTIGRQTSLSRSKISNPCRVEKPRDSRASLYTGALRVPRNNSKKESRKTVGNMIPSRKLPVVRESG
ncbi:10244_t:CDS:2, partial [Acaulospora colombiana]